MSEELELRSASSSVQRMFSAVAPRYDLLNRLLSLGLDQSWRRAAADAMHASAGDRALDLCCGSGDLALCLPEATIIYGCDFSEDMLRLAQTNLGPRGYLTGGDAVVLPYASQSFDVVAIAFGIRNLADRLAGFGEIRRVLKQNGRMIVLEFSRPGNRAFRFLHRWYLDIVVTGLGRLLSPDAAAYGYLADSISTFPDPGEIVGDMRQTGYRDPSHRALSGGIVTIYSATA